MIISKIITKLFNLFDIHILGIYKRIKLLNNGVTYERFPKIWGIPVIRNRGTMQIGKNCIITSRQTMNPTGGNSKTFIFVAPGCKLSIGNNVAISNAIIHVKNEVIIEDQVMIGGGCQIFDSDFHSIEFGKRMKSPDIDFVKAKTTIKKGAFIGASSIILKGVTIGERSVIGAGSVVSKSVPDDEIWAGNPAKKIKTIKNESFNKS